MEKLNVCLINDSFPPAIDGVANAVTNYAKFITSDHGNATVVTPFYPDADDTVFDFPVVRYPSIDVTKLVGYRAGMPFSAETMEKLEGSNFDIIHSHCPITSTMLSRALRDRINVPVVMTYHTKFDIDIANAIKSKALQEEAAKILVENISACDEIWTVSRGAGENLVKLGYKGDYIVMPNGVDFPKGRVSDEEIAAATEGYDLPAELPTFLFVGRMMWYKGIRIILDALKILREQGIAFRMVFIGAGNDKDEIMAYTEELGLSDTVIFVPAIHDRNIIRAWYCRADLFLFPSTFDTNGLVVREAAACALASVLVSGSCAAEDSTDGVDGFLIEENAESMAAKLIEVSGSRELMKTTGENAQKNLYMSWQDSVSAAYERYGIVIDKYKRGEYRKHEGFSDEVFHTTAEALDRMIIAHQHRQQVRNEFIRYREAVREQRTNMVEDFNRYGEQVREELRNEKSLMQADISEMKKRMEEKKAELIEQLERFM